MSLSLIVSSPLGAHDGEDGHTHTFNDSHLQNVESMLELLGTPQQVNKVAADMMKLYSVKVDPGSIDPNMQKMLDAYQQAVSGVVNQVLGWGALKTTYINSYANRLSPQEVAAVSGFLLSPEGQKFSKVQQQAAADIQETTKHLAEVDMAPALTELATQLRLGLAQLKQAQLGTAPK